jgi:cysteine-rich repeat protein
MRAVGLILAAGAVGCGAVDPCAHHAGVCIGLRVEGSVGGLDGLAVTVDKPVTKTQKTPEAAITLPVALALNLPAGTSGAVFVVVEGQEHGNTIAVGSTQITINGSRGSGTVRLSGGGVDFAVPPDLLGAGSGSTDMAGCGTACVNGDGCCPSGCNANNDNDCASVCGNQVVEPGEVCDDGNSIGGDGCDPTCRWREQLDLVSGFAGGSGHADDDAYRTRLSMPTGITADATNMRLYFTSSSDCTIRQANGNLSAPTVTTLAGSAWDCGSADASGGDLTTARFANPTDVELIGSTLFVVDNFGAQIRAIDLTNKKTTTPISGISVQGIGQYGGKLVYFDMTGGTGGLKTYDPTQPISGANPATASGIGNFAGGSAYGTLCYDVACDTASCYIVCQGNVSKVAMGAPAVSNYAGYYNGSQWVIGCIGTSSVGATSSSALFTNATRIIVDSAHNLMVTDFGCNTVIKIDTAQGKAVRFAGVGGSGYIDGVTPLSAAFSTIYGIANLGTDYYVADQGNNVIRWLTSFDVFTNVGVVHNPQESAFVVGSPIASPNYAYGSLGLASDGNYIYALDATQKVLKVNLTNGGASIAVRGADWMIAGVSLKGLALIGTTLYSATGNGMILSVGVDGSNGGRYAGTANSTSPPSDGPRLSAVMNPIALTTDGTRLFFNDGGTQIRYIDAGGTVHTIAGATFTAAGAIITDGTYVYVADAASGAQGANPPTAVARVEIATGKVTTLAGVNNSADHIDGSGDVARFSGITALATDGTSIFASDLDIYTTQKLHIAPTIRELVLKTNTVTTMIGVPGQQTFKTGSGVAARVHTPSRLIFDAPTHALYLFDDTEYVFARIK